MELHIFRLKLIEFFIKSLILGIQLFLSFLKLTALRLTSLQFNLEILDFSL